jgi:hypothetical protein
MLEASIPEIEKEEDRPDLAVLQKDSVEEIKARREEARKDADSAHARNRDTWITIAGMILVLIMVAIYNYTVRKPPPDKDTTSLFLNLLDSVIMLVIGYIFGTKITKN